jgi:NAD kinase
VPDLERIVVVTKRTSLEELVERFGTRDQARFYVEHQGLPFDDYADSHERYTRALAAVRDALPAAARHQLVERTYLPSFHFGPRDLVVVLGPDGLVVNVAKYLSGQPILAVNPDPARIDGVLVPFGLRGLREALAAAMAGRLAPREITMARAALNDGQSLLAVNDLFIGRRTHVSARYVLRYAKREERQSSSGIIVSTGAGSTGWLRSVLAGAAGVVAAFADDKSIAEVRERYRFDWSANHLCFSVREPFASRATGAELVFGRFTGAAGLTVVSEMAQDGVIFSDGVETDFLAFNAGAVVTIGVADRKARLLMP